MIISTPTSKRGDIWLANFDPTVGAEIKKIRPAVIVSSDGVGKLPIKLIAPITDWKEYYAANIWHVKIEPDTMNSLTKASAVDVLQLRGMLKDSSVKLAYVRLRLWKKSLLLLLR